MGELVILDRVREARSDREAVRQPVRFYFDPGDPLCYVAIERIERICGEIEWVPAAMPLCPDAQALAERVARMYGLPLVWPERPAASHLPVLRASAFAEEAGAGARFAVACARLAFAGGYELDDPTVIMEAAGAAGLDPRDARAAAEDEGWDFGLVKAAAELHEQGIHELPTLSLADGRWYAGLDALEWSPVYAGRPHTLAG